MTNPIFKAYQSLDDTIMKGVNVGVRAWNWTTGDTKAGLANKMLKISPFILAAGPIIKDRNYVLAAFSGLLAGSYSVTLSFVNNRIENKENEAAKNATLDYHVEILKRQFHGAAGPMLGSYAICCTLLPEDGTKMPPQLFGILNAASHYIMRADSLPPRKDCISRGIESLVDKYQSYQQQKALVPQLARQQRLWGII